MAQVSGACLQLWQGQDFGLACTLMGAAAEIKADAAQAALAKEEESLCQVGHDPSLTSVLTNISNTWYIVSTFCAHVGFQLSQTMLVSAISACNVELEFDMYDIKLLKSAAHYMVTLSSLLYLMSGASFATMYIWYVIRKAMIFSVFIYDIQNLWEESLYLSVIQWACWACKDLNLSGKLQCSSALAKACCIIGFENCFASAQPNYNRIWCFALLNIDCYNPCVIDYCWSCEKHVAHAWNGCRWFEKPFSLAQQQKVCGACLEAALAVSDAQSSSPSIKDLKAYGRSVCQIVKAFSSDFSINCMPNTR